jgi:hypothetical protein
MMMGSFGTPGGSFDLPVCRLIGSGKPNTCQGGKAGPGEPPSAICVVGRVG